MKLPSDPHQRRIIVVVPQDQVPSCASLLAQHGVAIMPLPAASSDPLAREITEATRIAHADVLIQSPFHPDHYVCADEAEDVFAREKHAVFKEICSLLGAVECSSTEQHESTETTTHGTAGEVNVAPYANVEVRHRSKSEEGGRSVWTQVSRFKGSDPDLEAARRLLKQRGLEHEPTMRTLITTRAGSNQLLEHELTLDLLSECKSQMSVVGKLQIPQALTQLKVKVDSAKTSTKRLKLKMRVRFPQEAPVSTKKKFFGLLG